jgi:dipeptidyl aminopeptidase/acylaminoacyl peptidase
LIPQLTMIRVIHCSAACVVAVGHVLTAGAQAPHDDARSRKDTLPIRAVLEVQTLRSVTVSHDANLFAFIRDNTVWVRDIPRKDSGAITLPAGYGVPSFMEWDPNAHRLALIADSSGSTALFLWEPSASSIRRVGRFSGSALRWMPSGRTLLVAIPAPNADSARLAGARQSNDVAVAVHRSGKISTKQYTGELAPTVEANRPSHTLALYDPVSGATTNLSISVPEGVGGLNRDVVLPSPDDRHLAIQTLRIPDEPPPRWLCDVEIFTLATNSRRAVAHDLGCTNWRLKMTWSPDSRWLAIMTSRGEGLGLTIDPGNVFIAASDGGKAQLLSRKSHPNFNSDRSPLWNRSSDKLYVVGEDNYIWALSRIDQSIKRIGTVRGAVLRALASNANGNAVWPERTEESLLAFINDSASLRQGFAQLDVKSGVVKKVFLEDAQYSFGFGFWPSADGKRVVYWREDLRHPPDLWTNTSDLTAEVQLTRLNPQLEQYDYGTPRVLTWQTQSGALLRGALLLPPSYTNGRRLPLIVEPYPTTPGRPELGFVTNINRFGMKNIIHHSVLASRGYATLLVAVPQGSATPMEDVAKAILPAVDTLIARGVADPARLAVVGHSQGGGNVAALLVSTSRFKAAIAYSAGFLDRAAQAHMLRKDWWERWALTFHAEKGPGRMNAPLWERRAAYIDNSPLFFANRIKTPVLIIAGQQDPIDWYMQSELLYQALQRLGKPALFIRYPDEGHIVGSGANAAALDLHRRILSWLAEYLEPGNE